MKTTPLLLLLCLGSFTFGANVQLWTACTDQYCAYLYETPPCGLSVKVATTSGFTLFQQPFDLAVSNQVCAPQLLGCTYCIELQNLTKGTDGTVHPCIYLKSNCTSGAKTNTNLGCVTQANNIAQCLYPQGCPGGCSNHGTCLSSGKCQCNSGWYGDDCSDEAPLFDECITIPPYGDVCLRLETEDCAIDTTIYFKALPSAPLYHNLIMAPQFNTYFDTESCFSITPNCGACLYWTDFMLTETYAKACPNFNASCPGLPPISQQFDCFEDDALVAACFGPCPNNCSNHGDCVNGACKCNSLWKGSTCNIPSCDAIGVYNCYGNGECIAPNTCKCNDGWTGSSCEGALCSGVADCSGHGRCTGPNHCSCDANFTGASCAESACPYQCIHGECAAGACKCAAGWEGGDCNTKQLTPGKDGHTPKATYVVIGVVVGLVVAGAGGLGTFFVLRWRRTQRTGSALFSLDDGGLIQVPDEPESDER